MLEVTQADREAAQTWWDKPMPVFAPHVEDLAETLARHRLAERDAVVKWLRGLHWTHLDAEPAKRIANAIEAGEPFK